MPRNAVQRNETKKVPPPLPSSKENTRGQLPEDINDNDKNHLLVTR